MVDFPKPKQGRGRPKKTTTMTGNLAFRCPQHLVDWLEAEGLKRGLGIGDMARMYLLELKAQKKEEG